tara:strand:+ start:223 stop:357 length:135 start_codon:yes stop_codon:yes gene_type:complete
MVTDKQNPIFTNQRGFEENEIICESETLEVLTFAQGENGTIHIA